VILFFPNTWTDGQKINKESCDRKMKNEYAPPTKLIDEQAKMEKRIYNS